MILGAIATILAAGLVIVPGALVLAVEQAIIKGIK